MSEASCLNNWALARGTAFGVAVAGAGIGVAVAVLGETATGAGVDALGGVEVAAGVGDADGNIAGVVGVTCSPVLAAG